MVIRVPRAGSGLLTLLAFAVAAALWSLATESRPAGVTPRPGRAAGDPEFATLSADRRLAWIDRAGRLTSIAAPPRGYAYPRLSPDQRRIAIDIRDAQHGVWLWDFAEAALSPLVVGRASDIAPVWSRTGDWLLFSRGRGVAPGLFRLDIGGRGQHPAEPARSARLPSVTNSLLMPSSLTPDGRHVIVTTSAAAGFDVLAIDLRGDGRGVPVAASAADDVNGDLSPDGQWLAYQSRASGQFEIWVTRWGTGGVGRPVTTSGGTRPVWTRDGRELVYLTHAGDMMALAVSPGPTPDALTIGTPERLFTADIYRDLVGRTFDVSPDGDRFLVVIGL